MRKILLPLLLFIFSCENNDIESKKKKLDILKNSLVETYSEIEILEKEIILLEKANEDLKLEAQKRLNRDLSE